RGIEARSREAAVDRETLVLVADDVVALDDVEERVRRRRGELVKQRVRKAHARPAAALVRLVQDEDESREDRRRLARAVPDAPMIAVMERDAGIDVRDEGDVG